MRQSAEAVRPAVPRNRTLPSLCPWLGTLLLAVVPTAGRAADPITSPMYSDPLVPMPRVVPIFQKGVASLWIAALERPDATTKCAAAQAIGLAHRQGMPGLEVAIPALVRELERPGQHATSRLALAQALIALDARQTAEQLFRLLDADDTELREAIEPALARWDFKPARTVWLERLGNPVPVRRRVLAIQCLGSVREEKAVAPLRELVLSRTASFPVRLEAARALAGIRTSSSEADAETLATDATPQGATGRLLAVSLLRQHRGDAAVRLLQKFGQDTDPVVAAVALVRLVELDTKLVLPLLQPVLASTDANVRMFGVETLFRQPTDANLRSLGTRLSDPHPAVRSQARASLHELAAKPEWNAVAIREGVRVLGSGDWRGQEQAAILLANLDYKPAAKRLLELLDVERPEAFVAAAWATRQLAVPETLPQVLAYVRTQQRKLLKSGPTAGRRAPAEEVDRQLCQLIQFLGQAKYRTADPALREMLPRLIPAQTPIGPEARAAAVWALGIFHEGKADPGLVKALEDRLTDLPKPTGSEFESVRQMAAVALGRMRAQQSVPTLKRFYSGKPELDPVSNACGWAICQITGEPLPPAGIAERGLPAWFLTRIE